MCMAASCPTCQKTTWRGCGLHVPGVFNNVPEEKRCTCGPKVERDVGGKKLEFPPKYGEGKPTGLQEEGATEEIEGEVQIWPMS